MLFAFGVAVLGSTLGRRFGASFFSGFFSFRGFAFRPSGVGVRVLSMGLGF